MVESNRSSTANQPAAQRQLLAECKDMAIVYLTTQLNELFEQVEPVFLDFAKKAETNASQVRFFDSITQILGERERIEHRFRELIEQGFDEFAQGKPITYPNTPDEVSGEIELEMVDNEALEEHLAIQSMISRTQNDCYQQLFALAKRMAVLRGGMKMEDDDLPASPAHTAISFQQAAEHLDLDKQILLIVYFLFGKFVLGDARTIYQNLNDRLVEAGIFPNLKLTSIVPPAQRTAGAGEEGATGEKSDAEVPANSSGAQPMPSGVQPQRSGLGEEMFHSIHNLLTARRFADPEFVNHPEIAPNGNLANLRSAPAIVDAIQVIQPQTQADYLPDPDAEGGIPQTIELDVNLIQNVRRTLEAERSKLLKDLDKDTIPTADLDTIELVGMLFEEVLNEDGLANIAKAMVSHLHTPYLKVAILDKSFLTDESHIARKLLNLMVSAGKNWIDEEDLRRGIYYPMHEIIKEILAEFKNELSIFDEMFYKLNTQVEELEHRARILEERNQEAAKGRERLETARNQAASIIRERSKGRALHPVLERFLFNAWQDRLILMLLRDPKVEESKEWTSAMAVVDSLVRMMDARHNPKVREWLLKNQENLTKHIKAGLSSLGNYHHPDGHALFKLLASVLKETPAKEEEVTEEQAQAVEVSQPIIKPVKEPGKSTAARKEAPAPTPEEQEMLQTLRKVRFGTWFELVDGNNKQRRLKLSWFSPITHKYMFVDRFGIQAYITPSEELAKQLCNGSARIVKSSGIPFVSAALHKIHDLLMNPKGMHPAV